MVITPKFVYSEDLCFTDIKIAIYAQYTMSHEKVNKYLNTVCMCLCMSVFGEAEVTLSNLCEQLIFQ